VFQLLGSGDAAQDVVQETFYRAYRGARTFNSNFVSDPDRLKALVRGWLGGIANRVIADMLRRPEPHVVDPTLLEPGQAVWANSTDESTVDMPIIKALQEQVQKLSPLQQDILAAAALYCQTDTTYQRLPNGVAKKLAEKHGTNSNNIRQVRRRTLAQLRRTLSPLLDDAE
jgi:DNA-directed RNA polymerase specialized sigma24 family protein